MSKTAEFAAELKRETASTKAHLELVPLDKSDWKPHEKSMSLGRLASHVAEVPSWFASTLNQDVLDMAEFPTEPFIAQSTEELIGKLEEYLAEAHAVLETFPDENLQDNWKMVYGEMTYVDDTKEQVIRTWCLNHWYHHRAQLGVYLRMLDIPVPSTYGPTGG